MADPGSRLQLRAGRRMVERFADLPRPLLLAGGKLQVAPRQVDANRIAVDVVERLLCRTVKAAALHRDDQLDLVMEVLGQRRVGGGGTPPLPPVRMLWGEKRPPAPVISPPPAVFWVKLPPAPQAPKGERI